MWLSSAYKHQSLISDTACAWGPGTRDEDQDLAPRGVGRRAGSTAEKWLVQTPSLSRLCLSAAALDPAAIAPPGGCAHRRGYCLVSPRLPKCAREGADTHATLEKLELRSQGHYAMSHLMRRWRDTCRTRFARMHVQGEELLTTTWRQWW